MVKSSASAKGKPENHRHRSSLVRELMTRVGFHQNVLPNPPRITLPLLYAGMCNDALGSSSKRKCWREKLSSFIGAYNFRMKSSSAVTPNRPAHCRRYLRFNLSP